MAIMNFALLALVPFVLARPQVGHGDAHKALHVPRAAGTGPFSHAPAASGTAPFPVPGGNGTSGAATGSSGLPASSSNGPVVITSVINVVPQPIETYVTDSAQESGGAGNSISPASETGGSGESAGPEASGAGTECGPATVTITNANTVTVTVTPAGSAGAAGANTNGGAGASLPTIPSSAYIPPSQSAPFPIGNSSAPLGTGTGTPPTSTVAAVQITSSSVAAVVESTSSSVPAAQPYHAPVAEKYVPHDHPHPNPYQAPPPAVPVTPAYVAPPASQAPASQAASSAPAPAKSSAPTSGKPKGVAYNTPEQALQVSDASWACNWGQTADVPSANFDFVPQLWGKKPGMVDSIAGNCAGKSACLFYNEPDIPQSEGGSEIDVGTVTGDYLSVFEPIRKAGTKTSSPCVANSGHDYLSTFLSGVYKAGGKVDILCYHWYGPNDVSQLKTVVDSFGSLASQYGIEEVWINEWAVQPAPGSLSDFTGYLDGAVTRYAYNMNDMEGSTGY